MTGIALYGNNGHQITEAAKSLRGARLCGSFGFTVQGLRRYASEEELAGDASVTLVSVCADLRSQQGAIIRRLLEAGKDVYAEKPLAMSAEEIRAMYALAREKGRFLGEMSDTVFQQPYAKLKELAAAGTVGRIIQVHVQKSYPYADWRPQDEDRDGGLIRQCAVHAVRILEQGLGLRIDGAHAVETSLGNPVAGGGLKMAACLVFGTKSGAVCSVDANYLNPKGNDFWCNEGVTVFGERGCMEADFRTCTVTVTDDAGKRIVRCEREEGNAYLQAVIDFLNGAGARPLTDEEEMRPSLILAEVKNAVDR